MEYGMQTKAGQIQLQSSWLWACMTLLVQVCKAMHNVIIHHLHHFFTSKKNLDDYPSLKHYRSAASKRSSFHETLLQRATEIKNRTRVAVVQPSVPNS
jgi:hypothetical protein